MALSASQIAGSGSQWMLGIASKTMMPGDGIGSTATQAGSAPTNGEISGSSTYGKTVVVSGILVLTAAAVSATLVYVTPSDAVAGNPATLTTLAAVSGSAVGFVSFGPEGIKVPATFNSFGIGAIGMTSGAGLTATLVYKVIS